MMLGKYDEAIAIVEKSAPLNPLYDDVARLRMVRANLREVTPELEGGEVAKARKSFAAFETKLPSVSHQDALPTGLRRYREGFAGIKSALMAEKPDVDHTVALVNGMMEKYNAVVTDVTKEARSR